MKYIRIGYISNIYFIYRRFIQCIFNSIIRLPLGNGTTAFSQNFRCRVFPWFTCFEVLLSIKTLEKLFCAYVCMYVCMGKCDCKVNVYRFISTKLIKAKTPNFIHSNSYRPVHRFCRKSGHRMWGRRMKPEWNRKWISQTISLKFQKF